MLSKQKVTITTLSILFIASIIVLVRYIIAYNDSTEFSFPIKFNATQDITAIDYSVELTGATLVDLECGKGSYEKFIEHENKCVIYHTDSGQMNGFIGSITARTLDPNIVKVMVNGHMSTELGDLPQKSRFEIGQASVVDGSILLWFFAGGLVIVINLMLVNELLSKRPNS